MFLIAYFAEVDVHYKFIAVFIVSNGKNSNGGIFANSEPGKEWKNCNLNVPKHFTLAATNIIASCVIVGDDKCREYWGKIIQLPLV